MVEEAFEAAVENSDLELEVYDNDGNGYVRLSATVCND
jgi:hypothetical protein